MEGQAVTPAVVMLHEILHTLGLEHPYDNPKRPTPWFAQNKEHTILADLHLGNQGFNSNGKSYGVSSTPMMWDVAGLQHLYGANKKTNRGNTTYRFSSTEPFYKTIWDASGVDTLDLSNFSRPLKINLSEGKLSTLSFDVNDERWSNKIVGNLGIAFDCVIENSVGGTSDDVITGNAADNILRGLGGNDTLNGTTGHDRLIGGPGLDTFQIQPDKGHVVIEDFTDGEDKIALPKNIKTKIRTLGNDIEAFHNEDLVAVVRNAANLLQQDGATYI